VYLDVALMAAQQPRQSDRRGGHRLGGVEVDQLRRRQLISGRIQTHWRLRRPIGCTSFTQRGNPCGKYRFPNLFICANHIP